MCKVLSSSRACAAWAGLSRCIARAIAAHVVGSGAEAGETLQPVRATLSVCLLGLAQSPQTEMGVGAVVGTTAAARAHAPACVGPALVAFLAGPRDRGRTGSRAITARCLRLHTVRAGGLPAEILRDAVSLRAADRRPTRIVRLHARVARVTRAPLLPPTAQARARTALATPPAPRPTMAAAMRGQADPIAAPRVGRSDSFRGALHEAQYRPANDGQRPQQADDTAAGSCRREAHGQGIEAMVVQGKLRSENGGRTRMC
jgi:hypothetical protein